MLSTAAKLRAARLLYSLLRVVRTPLKGGDSVEVTRKGIRWRLDLREGIDLTIYLAGAFEGSTLRQLQRLVRPGMHVIDVGANIGAHTLHLATLVGPGGSVLAFEPTSFGVRKLRANLAENPELKDRVDVRQCFLVGPTDGGVPQDLASSWPVDGRRPDDADLGSIGMSTDGATATTLDQAIAAAGARRVDLMKLDVDGHELGVLRGAERMLRHDRPVIVMELAPYVFQRPEDFDSLLELLWKFDYDLVRIGGAEPFARQVAMVRAAIPAKGSVNVTAIRSGATL